MSPMKKNMHPLQVFYTKSSKTSLSSTFTSTKIKTLIHTFIVSQLNRLVRSLSKAKSVVLRIIKEIELPLYLPSKEKQRNRIFLGSFRLHYNFGSSHRVLPLSDSIYCSTWNSFTIDTSEPSNCQSRQLSGYLHWLEDEIDDSNESYNDIDKLADMFIASCHEKFILEKQESYRRLQEMMDRSV